MRPDPDLGTAPEKDTYFLGRLDMSTGTCSYTEGDKKKKGFFSGFSSLFEKLTFTYHLKYLPLGFMQMVVMDDTSFDRDHYDFKFVRREFLGDVRCLVIDVVPKPSSGTGRFIGRIWVEDLEYNIVRFNGSYTPKPHVASTCTSIAGAWPGRSGLRSLRPAAIMPFVLEWTA